MKVFVFLVRFTCVLLLFVVITLHTVPLPEIEQTYFAQPCATLSFHTISYNPDSGLSRTEFEYLVGFKQGVPVTFEQIAQAGERLDKRQRFTSVDLCITADEKGHTLHFECAPAWILSAVLIKGILFNRERYAGLYSQQEGEIFDVSLHEESCEVIRDLLKQDGYINCAVRDELHYDHGTKKITAKLYLKKGSIARISSLRIQLKGGDKRESCVLDELAQDLENKNAFEIGKAYVKDRIKRIKQRCKSFLGKAGYRVDVLKSGSRSEKEKRVDLLFVIHVNKQLAVSFSGNTLFASSELNQLFVEDQPAWLLDSSIISEQVAAHYKKCGYVDVSVTAIEESDFVFHFSIQEGTPLIIKHVELHDIHGIPLESSTLRSALTKHKFDTSFIEQRLLKERNACVKNGYWDCQLSYRWQRVEDGLRLDIVVRKGKQRRVNAICLHGLDKELQEELEKDVLFNSESNSLTTLQTITELSEKISSFLHGKGYWYAQVHPEIIPVSSTDDVEFIRIRWVIDPGAVVRVGKVILNGTSRLPFSRVLTELPFKLGERWQESNINLARARLEDLTIFKTVKVQPYDILKQEKEKDIVVTLTDDTPFELRFRAGYFLTSKNFLFRQQSTYKLGGTFLIKNPTNVADMLTTNFEITRFERLFDIDYRRPHFFYIPAMGSIKAYSNKYVHPMHLGDSESAYEAEQHGVLASISNQYKHDYHWGFSLGHEWIRVSRVRGDLNFNCNLVNRTLPYLFFEPTLVINRLDNKLDPEIGGVSFGSVKLMFPYKKGEVISRILLEQSLFYPLFYRVTGALRIRWGHILGQQFENIMPIERFYLGGAHTVRGYEKDAMPPLGCTRSCRNGKNFNDFTIQGGSSMFNVNLEARIRLWHSLQVVLFHDIGVLTQHGVSPIDGEWLPTSGFGLRYLTPIGPLRFDIGWKWKKQFKQQSDFVWYLTLGHAF